MQDPLNEDQSDDRLEKLDSCQFNKSHENPQASQSPRVASFRAYKDLK